MLNSKDKVPIKPDHHRREVNSSMMMLKMLTALVLIGSIGAKYFLVKTEGKYATMLHNGIYMHVINIHNFI